MLYDNIAPMEKATIMGTKKKVSAAKKKLPKAVLPKRSKQKLGRKKKSKVVLPDHFGGKESLQAFRTTKDIKKMLAGVENKSKFINDALILALSKMQEVECPTCKGKGKLHEIDGHRV